MGNTYFYGKIVSLMGSNASKGKDGMKSMMQFMLMNQMMGGNANMTGAMTGSGSNMIPMMLMMNGGSGSIFDGMLDGLFDFASEDEPDVDMEAEEDEE